MERAHTLILRKVRRSIELSLGGRTPDRLLVGLSGGADSSVLLHVLCAWRDKKGGPREIVAAHVHHRTRGDESDRDAAASERLARQHDVEFHVLHLRPRKAGKTPEHELRDLRLAALARLGDRMGIRWIALGHQRDDQAETVLLRLLTGTDLRGLSGISAFRPPRWLHPLLDIPRETILEEAKGCGLPFVTDSSNEKVHARRNFLRLNVLPLLKREFNPRLAEHLCAVASSASRVYEFVEGEARGLLEEAKSGPGMWRIDALEKAPDAVRHVALQLAYRRMAGDGKALSRVQLAALDRLAVSSGKKRTYSLPCGIRAVAGEGRLLISCVRS